MYLFYDGIFNGATEQSAMILRLCAYAVNFSAMVYACEDCSCSCTAALFVEKFS